MKKLQVRQLLEKTLGMDLPQVDHCRHVLIAGDTASGKTHLLLRLIAAIPDGTRMDIHSTSRELESVKDRAIVYHEMLPHQSAGLADYSGHRPIDAFVLATAYDIAGPILMNTIRSKDRPSVITTITASYGSRHSSLLDLLADSTEAHERQPDVAVVWMTRDMDGSRIVKSVTTM